MLRAFLIGTVLATLAVVIVWGLRLDSAPDEVRALPLCERTWVKQYDSETETWVEAETPQRAAVVCEIEGATGTVDMDDEKRAHVDTPLEGQTIEVPCYHRPRMKPHTLPLHMPDGMYCNVPIPTGRRE